MGPTPPYPMPFVTFVSGENGDDIPLCIQEQGEVSFDTLSVGPREAIWEMKEDELIINYIWAHQGTALGDKSREQFQPKQVKLDRTLALTTISLENGRRVNYLSIPGKHDYYLQERIFSDEFYNTLPKCSF